MSPEHQVDEQLPLAVSTTFQLILNAFFDCLVSWRWVVVCML